MLVGGKQNCTEIENDGRGNSSTVYRKDDEVLVNSKQQEGKPILKIDGGTYHCMKYPCPLTCEDGKVEVCESNCDDYIKLTVSETLEQQSRMSLSKSSSPDVIQNTSNAVLFSHANESVIGRASEEVLKTVETNSDHIKRSGKKAPKGVSETSLTFLNSCEINRGQKKKTGRGQCDAHYYCDYCKRPLISLDDYVKHFDAEKHIRAEKRRISFNILKRIPLRIPKAHRDAIYNMLKSQFIPPARLMKLKEAADLLTKDLEAFLKKKVDNECSLRMFGSYFIGNFTERSDLNLSLTYPTSFTRGHIMHCVLNCLSAIEELPRSQGNALPGWVVKKVESEFLRFAPSIRATFKSNFFGKTSFHVLISIECERYIRMNNIIKFFSSFRSQFLEMSYIFRKWAEVCLLCSFDKGGLHKIGFDIMLIHFLQLNSVLPCFSEDVLPYPDKQSYLEVNFDYKKAFKIYGDDRRDWDLVSLWLQMLSYYALEHDCRNIIGIRWSGLKNKRWPWLRKKLAVRDPTTTGGVMQPCESFGRYFSSCLLGSYLYLRIPRDANGPLLPYILSPYRKSRTTRKSTPAAKSCEEKEDMDGKREIDTVDGNYLEKPTSCLLTSSNGKKVEVETILSKLDDLSDEISKLRIAFEKCLEKKNMIKRINSEMKEESKAIDGNINEKTNTDLPSDDSCISVLNPRRQSSCIYPRKIMFQMQNKKVADPGLIERLKKLGFYFRHEETATFPPIGRPLQAVDAEPKGECSEIQGMCENLSADFSIELNDVDEKFNLEQWCNLPKDFFHFVWSNSSFTANIEPQLKCLLCGKSGHGRGACNEQGVKPAITLHPLPLQKINLVTEVVNHVYFAYRMDNSHLMKIEESCSMLEKEISDKFVKDCSLVLFGSAVNGFGLRGSDADMCLRLGLSASVKKTTGMITEIAKVLKRSKFTRMVTVISHAKVPIIKLSCTNGLKADISLHNELAVTNTRLLRAYCELDPRVPRLGIAVKKLAKLCDIGDASKGSLSSYSYIIMLIHFLQRTTPPVLPFLQEEEPKGRKKSIQMVEGWDTFFCEPHEMNWRVLNKETIGMLWLEFLDYYTVKFDFTSEVVQIRKNNVLLKLDKGWEKNPVAIEDPFELNHNLSSGVDQKMWMFIKRTFAKSRLTFNKFSIPQVRQRSIGNFTKELYNGCRVDNVPSGGPGLRRWQVRKKKEPVLHKMTMDAPDEAE